MMFLVLVGLTVLGLSAASPLDSSRIHGGVDAPAAYAPHMVALLHGEFRVSVVCGGSIVRLRLVLTAAHCITPFIENDRLSPSFRGRVGSNNWQSGGTIINYEKHYVHPEWDEDTIKYDVGLLRVDENLVLSETVAVIGLDFGWVGGGVPCSVTGWGRTWPRYEDNVIHLSPTPDWLQLLYIYTLTPEECFKMFQSSEYWLSVAPALDHELEICAFHSVGYGMCHGDSGSGLVSLITGDLIGLVSWGMPCAVGAPDMFVRIRGVRDFIELVFGDKS